MRTKSVIFVFVFVGIFRIYQAALDVPIGAVFDVSEDEQETAFKHAVDTVNNNRHLFSTRLIPLTERVPNDNKFHVSKAVCSMLSQGVFAIFGPSSQSSSYFVQSLCDTKEIPHLQTTWNFRQKRGMCLANFHPHPPVLAYVLVEVVKAFRWKSFTVIYEDDSSLQKISNIINFLDMKKYIVQFKQLDTTYSGNYRPALKEVKKSGETHYILDCSIDTLEEVLKQALQVGMMSDHHHYVITNLDLHTIDLYPYRHGGANITGLQLVDPKSDKVKRVAASLRRRNQRHKPTSRFLPNPEHHLRVETALLYDAVNVFAEALHKLSISRILDSKQLFCNDSRSWEHGYSIINYMKTITVRGLTGAVKFDNEGFRSEFFLNILELGPDGLKKIGTWNSTEGLIFLPHSQTSSNNTKDEDLRNKYFTVAIALSEPYEMLKKTSSKLHGNDRYEGFGIDLIHDLSLILGFNYTFKLQEDGEYGSKNLTTGEWNGMIRQLLDEKADLAITDLTITSEREEAVDFTSPFMNLGISILYKKPMRLPPSPYSFLSPFSRAVWYYLGGAYVGVSLMLYVIARLSPVEWTNRYPCVNEPEYLENQFSFKNCFWFTLGSLMQQGSELAPVAISTRMVAGTWWFFTLILVSSYTANLAAFLTVDSFSAPFKTVEELPNQNVIKYGAKKGGATSNFFRNSTYSTYQEIWKFMEANPKEMTLSNPEGVKRAENEPYAFFMESTTIEYTVERHCNLTKVGRLLDDKGYGIAMRKNSSYRHVLSRAILKLQETGRLRDLKRKWWKEKRGGGLCTNENESGDTAELGLANLGGVFLVLVIGSAAGFFVAVFEFLMDVVNISFRNKTTYAMELKEEIHFLFNCNKQTKPVRCRRSRAPSRESFEDFEFPQSEYRYVPQLTKEPLH